jgi:hypothetical protein
MACEGGSQDWATVAGSASVPVAFVSLISLDDLYAAGHRLGDYPCRVASPGELVSRIA